MQLLTSILRTVVPYVWGLFITWLITLLPVLAPLEHQLLGLATIALPILAAVISAAWYAFWRWLQPRLPDWLVRAVLGSAKTPTYPGKHALQPSDVVIPRRQLEGWQDTPPLTGASWHEFAESLPPSEHATALHSVADALDSSPAARPISPDGRASDH